jgi:hypothetical protein
MSDRKNRRVDEDSTEVRALLARAWREGYEAGSWEADALIQMKSNPYESEQESPAG